MKAYRGLSLSLAALAGGLLVVPASAATVDDFESYATGTFPSPNWAVSAGDVSSLSSPAGQTITVESDGNNLSGKHLQLATTYNADSVTQLLSADLNTAGQYIQLAVNVVSGRTLASMFLTSGLYPGGNGQPPASVGLSTETGNYSFTTEHNGVYNAGLQVTGLTPALNTWYYLRAIMRDNGGVSGVIDSYDYQIYDSSMNLLGQKTGISFFGGEGNLSGVTLRSYEQTGTANAVVLFDQITTGAVPEPTTLALLAGFSLIGLARRRRM
jgi:hypothetical protein